jgi:iron complex outermembrane receptor protein
MAVRTLFLACLMVCAAGVAAAQSLALTGRVLDQDRAAVARATVVVTAVSSGQERRVTARDDGSFVVDGLSAGRHLIEVRATGFAPFIHEAEVGGAPVAIEAVLGLAGVTEELTVRGTTAAAVGRTPVPARDQPVTVNTVTSEFLQTYAVNDLVEALNNVTNVSAYQQYGVYEYYYFRGFNDSVQMVDGIRNEGNRVRSSLSNVERIEVLKGPSSVLAGSEAIGGTVNLVLKKPLATPVYDGSFTVGSFDTARASGGATGRLGREALLYRFDVGVEHSDNFRHDPWTRTNVTPTVSWRISPRDYVEARYMLNRNDVSGDGGIPQITNPDGSVTIPDVPRERRYNTPQDFSLATDQNIRVMYSRTLGNAFVARNVTAGRVYDDDYWVAESLGVVAPSAVTRTFLYFKHKRRPWQNQAEVTGHFQLGVRHDLLAGWDRQDYSSRTTRSANANITTTPIDLYNPVETHPTHTDFTISRYDYTDLLTNSFYVQDHVTLGSQLKLVGGIRTDMLDRWNHNNPVTNGVETEVAEVFREVNRTTWRAGAVYQPLGNLDFYGQAATSFRPNFNLQPDGSPIEPEEGEIQELGHRLRLLSDRLTFSTAVFHIEKRNVALSRPGGFFDIAGKIRSRGFEADVDGRVNANWVVRGGYGFVDAEYVDYVTTTAVLSGNQRPRAPRHSVNFSTSYSFRSGLGLSFGGRVLGDQFLNDANTLSFDGYALYNAAASYTRGRFQYSVNVNNLTDTEYWASTLGNRQFYPGEPRRVMAGVRMLID